MNDPYWTLDTSLFEGTFRYFGKELVQVRGKVHTEQERYRKSDINQEITPIAITQGERTYLHMKPFGLIPDIILTVGLYPAPRASRRDRRGRISTRTATEGSRDREHASLELP